MITRDPHQVQPHKATALPPELISAVTGGQRQAPWGSEDGDVLGGLRRGDEAAFVQLVDRHQRTMMKLAMKYVHDVGAAQDVVQETWVVVIEDISEFEGRSSLKNWIYAILVNLAKARGQRDMRLVPFASCTTGDEDESEVPHRHFARNPGTSSRELVAPWGATPEAHRTPEDDRGERETLQKVVSAITRLPPSQRAVIYLRDICGLTSEEVCERLAISDVAQRVRLHRARTRVRAAIFGTGTESVSADNAPAPAPGEASVGNRRGGTAPAR